VLGHVDVRVHAALSSIDGSGAGRPRRSASRPGSVAAMNQLIDNEGASQWKAVESIAEKLGVHRETLRVWVRRAEVDDGRRPGLTASPSAD